MKVMQINSVCGIGSTGRIATDIHQMLINSGNESYIAYGRGKPRNCDSTIKIGNIYSQFIHLLKTRLFDMHGFGSKRSTKQFIKEVRKINPDIVHLHNIHGYYINLEILFEYFREEGKPVVWTLHDCWAFTGHCVHFEYSGCECWKINGDHKCILQHEYPSSWAINNSRNNYERKKNSFTSLKDLTIVTPSKWLGKLVEKSFLKASNNVIINNGVDTNYFKPTSSSLREELKIGEKFIILGVASSWTDKKGLNYFYDLSSQLNESELIILVGLDKNQLKNLPENIIGIQKTHDLEELAELYSTANVFLNPTLEDTFPTVNLESLSCGTPVITFDTGGSSEIVSSDVGVVIKEKNVKNIKEAVNEIKGKEEFYFDACINRARSLYDKKNNYNHYLNLYATLLTGG